MKRLVILISLCWGISLSSALYAQRKCGSTFNFEKIKENSVQYKEFLHVENNVNKRQKSAKRLKENSITIPVVVHILHNGEDVGHGLNLSNEQILSQIEVLNEDYNRLNADRVNTPEIFETVSADFNITFKLATVDPNGNATNGIIGKKAGKSIYYYNEDHSKEYMKYSTYGSAAWDSKKYLNIWVCNLGGGLLGYAQFPYELQNYPQTDGVVINYNYFGRDGSALPPYEKGRTATHEVGHWLNLYHIWGDKTGCNTGTDFCEDTPDQYHYNMGV